MHHSPHNAWFINFSGIGNGIVAVPILKCFELSYPLVNYYHTENQILADTWFLEKASLHNLKGLSPVVWRRFKEENWIKITSFVKEREINLIVNLRNEGPRYDIGYYKFKERILQSENRVDFLDLDFNVIEQRTIHQNLFSDTLAFLSWNGVNVSDYNPRWLESIRAPKNQSNSVGFGMAASQKNKRWPTHKWANLAHKILSDTTKRIILFPGTSAEELEDATRVLYEIGQEKCKVISGKSLKETALCIGGMCCFVSNDTGLLHMAAATGVPSVGLYRSTNSEIWSPYDVQDFVAFQNSFIKKCPDPKLHCGNCLHYYDFCPAIMQHGDDIEPCRVYEAVERLIA